MMTSTRHGATSGYRPDIDGLRAIAVTAVILYHAHLGTCESGFVGVDIFFAISGYLIAGIIFREVTSDRFTFAGFYARRARRILPALIAVVFASTIAGFFFLGPGELHLRSASAASALLGFSNIHFYHATTTYFAADSGLEPMLMTWSLGVEEQFYVFFPVVLILLHRFIPKHIFLSILLLTLGSFVLSLEKTAGNPRAAFYLPAYRAWELGPGALLAIAQNSPGRSSQSNGLPRFRPQGPLSEVLSVLGVGLLIEAIFYLQGPFPGWRALVPVAGATALILSESSFINRTILSFKPLVGLGLISYSWYLWHWPLMSFTRSIAMRPPPKHVMAGLVAASFIAGILSWRFVEQPFRRATAQPVRTLTQYGIALAGIFLVGGVLDLHGIPARVSLQAREIDAQIEAGHDGGCLFHKNPSAPNMSPRCVSDSADGIALLGDSHAHALAPALRRIAQRHGYVLTEMTNGSCPPLIGVTRALPDLPQHAAQCDSFNKAALATVLGDPGIKIVVLTGFWAGPAYGGPYISDDPAGGVSGVKLLENGLTAYEQALVRAGKRVVVVGDVPLFSFDAGQEALLHTLPAKLFVYRLIWGDDGLSGGRAPWSLMLQPPDGSGVAVQKAAENIKGVMYYDPTGQFCSADGCLFLGGPAELYFADAMHLALAGSILAGKPLEAMLFPSR